MIINPYLFGILNNLDGVESDFPVLIMDSIRHFIGREDPHEFPVLVSDSPNAFLGSATTADFTVIVNDEPYEQQTVFKVPAASAPTFPVSVSGSDMSYPQRHFALSDTRGGWYEFTDSSTLFQDTAGATPITAAGQTIRRINSKYGNVGPLTRSGTGLLWQDLGGYMSGRFDGAQEIFTSAGVLTGSAKNNGLTQVAVFQYDNDTGSHVIMDSDYQSGRVVQGMMGRGAVGVDDAVLTSIPGTVTSFSTGPNAPENTKVLVVISVTPATGYIARVNGVTVASDSTARTITSSNISNSRFALGASYAGTLTPNVARLTGNIIAAAYLSRGMAIEEIKKLEQHFAALGGITLP